MSITSGPHGRTAIVLVWQSWMGDPSAFLYCIYFFFLLYCLYVLFTCLYIHLPLSFSSMYIFNAWIREINTIQYNTIYVGVDSTSNKVHPYDSKRVDFPSISLRVHSANAIYVNIRYTWESICNCFSSTMCKRKCVLYYILFDQFLSIWCIMTIIIFTVHSVL